MCTLLLHRIHWSNRNAETTGKVNESLMISAAHGYSRSVTWALEAGADFGHKDNV